MSDSVEAFERAISVQRVATRFAAEDETEKEAVAPEGWEPTVKKMKKHPEIDNPWALAWHMKNKGDTPGGKEAARVADSRDDTDVDGFNLAILPRLRTEVERIIRGAGKIVDLVAYAEAKGGGWSAVLDTEYAGLKLYYVYRRSDAHLDKKGSNWVVSVK
jgi:hypothetical protein